MRVAFDGDPLLPPRSGVGHYTAQLIRALARAEPAHAYLVFYLRPVRRLWAGRLPAFPAPAVEIVRPPWLASLRASVRRRLGRRVPVEHFVGPIDVFHATNNIFPHPVAAARRVLTVHDLTLILYPQWHPRERLRQMAGRLPAAVEAAQRIVVPSLATRNDLVKHVGVPTDRIVVIPEAADPSFCPLPRGDVELALGRLGLEYGRYFLFVGTVEPRKNLAGLLDALELCGTRIGPLVVAGAEGWGNVQVRRRLDRLARAGRARYLGYVADALRPALIGGARAFVYPSLYEGFGLPPLEAMACGIPVLTSGVSSLPEVVGDAALLVDPCDVDALAAAMRQLWEDETLRADLAARGLRRAARFSWEATARETLRVYRDVMAETGGGAAR